MASWKRNLRLWSLVSLIACLALLGAGISASVLPVVAVASFLSFFITFHEPPSGPRTDVSALMKKFDLADADVLREQIKDGYLFANASIVGLVPFGGNQPAWTVPASRIASVEFKRSFFSPLADRLFLDYTDENGLDKRKRFVVTLYGGYHSRHSRKQLLEWVAERNR